MGNQFTRSRTYDNTIFALSVFVLFILLFENKLVIPDWLQPLGRMHPLILHMPIFLLLVYLCLEFFRVTMTNHPEKRSYETIIPHLFFVGVVTAALAVIMGIFLAREEAYSDPALSLHKWTGVAVFFVAAILFVIRTAKWYNAAFAKTGAIITVISLIAAGHFGGTLTHGPKFIWKPVLSEAKPVPVPIEEARAFEHVIKPVFEGKCVSCHNPDRRKGGLLLTDSISFRKGGKNGQLFIADQPDSSLLLRRIHLPIDEKKHMPPSGKPQLTREEKAVLVQWVRSGLGFDTRVLDLPETDSFRLAALAFLDSRRMDDQYDFPAVAQHTLSKLNSDFRVIRPVSRNSPALAVNIYNREVYTPKTLDDLKEVKLQVITLDVSKMPLTDEDVRLIARFDNLRNLNLNFTEVTGDGLIELQTLHDLEEISLAGTSVDAASLTKLLPSLPNLRSLALWNTPVTAVEIESLARKFPHVSFLGSRHDDEPLIKLNLPRVKNTQRVFRDSILLELFHPVKDTEIRYSLDRAEPDSLTSPVFRRPVIFDKTVAIKARAYKKGWRSSDVATLNVYRSRHKPDTAILRSKLNRVHTANGANTFFDHELGGFNANSPAWANNWAGFIRNEMELYLYYDSLREIRSVSLNTLIETETSIFPPTVIEVWGGPSESSLVLIARKRIDLPTVYRKPYIELFDVAFEERSMSCLRIVAKPLIQLPAWHKDKNKPALMLIDEILIN